MKQPEPGLKEQFLQEQEQKRLKREYGITTPNTIIKERKSRIVIVLLHLGRGAIALLKTAFYIAIALLALIGLAGLIFPGPHAALREVFKATIEQIRQFTGM